MSLYSRFCHFCLRERSASERRERVFLPGDVDDLPIAESPSPAAETATSPRGRGGRRKPILLLVFIFVALTEFASPSPAADQPNFIVVFCDNLGYGDIEPFGSTLHRTPNLNRMAKAGPQVHALLRHRRCLHAVAGKLDDRLLRAASRYAHQRSRRLGAATTFAVRFESG